MSIDLPTDPAACDAVRRRFRGMESEPIRNVMVFYGGHQPGMNPGGTITQYKAGPTTETRTSYDAFVELRKLCDPSTSAIGYDPALIDDTSNRAVRTGMDFIRNVNQFDPRGMLVVYGFSAGGFNAARLCERMQRYYGWYDFETKRLGNIHDQQQQNQLRFARAQVDLLVTVDPCLQDLGRNFTINTATPIVRSHFNFYQNIRPPGGLPDEVSDRPYWGISAPHANNAEQEREPPVHLKGNSPHDRMPIHTLDEVRLLVRGEKAIVLDSYRQFMEPVQSLFR